jgi:hypothetical protein
MSMHLGQGILSRASHRSSSLRRTCCLTCGLRWLTVSATLPIRTKSEAKLSTSELKFSVNLGNSRQIPTNFPPPAHDATPDQSKHSNFVNLRG